MKLLVLGQATTKAKIDHWSRESLSLPPAFLAQGGRESAQMMVGWGEQGGQQLAYAIGLIRTDLGQRGDPNEIGEHDQALVGYWQRASAQFRATLADADREGWEGAQIARVWQIRLIGVLNGVWEDALPTFGQSGRALAAIAKREGIVGTFVRDLIPTPLPRAHRFAGTVRAMFTRAGYSLVTQEPEADDDAE